MVQVHGVLILTLLEMLYLFGVDNISSSPSDNRKNNFLILGEDPVMVLMEALNHQNKSLVLILLK